MHLFRKLQTFFSLPGRVHWLFFKAIFISALVKITLVFRPFKEVLGWLGEINTESDQCPHPESEVLRTDIKTAIVLCNKYTFWKTECYTQALTCRFLLKKYNLPSTIYIGFNNYDRTYKGHAWLRSYDTILTGGEDKTKFNLQYFFT